jgi:hypothetical protein
MEAPTTDLAATKPLAWSSVGYPVGRGDGVTDAGRGLFCLCHRPPLPVVVSQPLTPTAGV